VLLGRVRDEDPDPAIELQRRVDAGSGLRTPERPSRRRTEVGDVTVSGAGSSTPLCPLIAKRTRLKCDAD
jgi:hypothetical protein